MQVLFGFCLDCFVRRETLVICAQLIIAAHKLQPSLVALLECMYIILLQLIDKLFTPDYLLAECLDLSDLARDVAMQLA